MSEIQRKLSALRGRIKRSAALLGLAKLFLATGLYAGAAALLDYLFRLPPVLRLLLGGGGLGLFAWLAYSRVLSVLLMRLPDVELAKLMEKAYPELKEALVSAVEFAGCGESGAASDEPGAPGSFREPSVETRDFVRAIASAAEAQAAGLSLKPILRRRYLVRAASAAACVIAAWAGYTIGFRTYAKTFLLRYATPFAEVDYPKRTRLDVLGAGADHTILLARGENLEVRVRARPAVTSPLWHPPEKVYVYYRFASGEGGKRKMVDLDRGVYAAYFPAITEELEFSVAGDDDRTANYRVRLIERPRLVKLRLTLDFPAYTGLPAKELPEGSGSLSAVVGTRVTINAQANKRLRGATVKLGKQAISGRIVDPGDSFVAAFVIGRDDREYAIVLKDVDTGADSEPIGFKLSALADKAPSVHIIAPPAVKDVSASATVPVKAEISDDFGVAAATLHYRIEKAENRVKLAVSKGQKDVKLSHNWEIGSLKLKEGSRVVYWLEATDLDDVSGPNVGRSAEHELRILSPAELLTSIERQKDALKKLLKETIQKQKATKGDVDHLLQKGAKGEPLPEEDHKLIHASAKGQTAVKSLTASAAVSAQNIASELGLNKIGSSAEQQALADVARSLEATSERPMEDAIKSLSEAQAERDSAKQLSGLDAASAFQQSALTALEEALRRLESSQEIDRLIQMAAELLAKQEKLAENTKTLAQKMLGKPAEELSDKEIGSIRSLGRRQKAAAEDMKALDAAMHSVAEKLAETTPDAAALIRSAISYAASSRIQDHMGSAAQSIEANQLSKAYSEQETTRRGLAELLNLLRKSRQPGLAASKHEFAKNLDKALKALDSLITEEKGHLEKSGVESAAEALKSGDKARAAHALGKAKAAATDPKRLEQILAKLEEGKTEEAFKQLDELRTSVALQKDLRFEKMADLQQGTSARADELRSQLETLANEGKEAVPEEAQDLEKTTKPLSEATSQMNEASRSLKRESPLSAAEQQDQALQKLQEARQNLNSLLSKMNEQERKQKLFDVAAELRKVLDQQKQINAETQRIGRLPEIPRAEELHLKKLAESQGTAAVQTQGVLDHLKHDRVVTFSWVLTETIGTMKEIQGRLAQSDPYDVTQYLEQEVERHLAELLRSFEREYQAPSPQGDAGGGQGGGQGGPQRLVPPSAELKLLKAFQTEIYETTKAVDLERETKGRLTRLLEKKLERIRIKEKELSDLAKALAESLEKQK